MQPNRCRRCLQVYLFLLQLIVFTKQLIAEQTVKEHDQKIESLIIQINNNYGDKWTIESMAAAAKMNINSFRIRFKRYMGISPLIYVKNIKLNSAKTLLLKSNLKIREVSELLGYDDPFYFSRLFHKNTGESPTEYRKNILK